MKYNITDLLITTYLLHFYGYCYLFTILCRPKVGVFGWYTHISDGSFLIKVVMHFVH